VRRSASAAPRPAIDFALVLAAVCAAAIAAWLRSGQPLVGSDDANIFFVYARNWLDGHGLVYNAGGERVEGFTSPLFLAVAIAAFAWAPWPELAIAAAETLAIAFALFTLVRFVGDHVLVGRRARWLALAWALSWPAFIGWTVLCLMDTGLWTAAIVAACVAVLRVVAGDDGATHPARWAAIGALLPLVRPEGMAWVPMMSAVLFAASTTPRATAGARRAAGLCLAAGAACALALTAARLAYFGYPLPNTWYAKVSPDFAYNLATGSRYLVDFLRASPLAALMTLAGLAGVLTLALRPVSREADEVAPLLLASTVLVATGLAIPVIEGGDHHGLFRAYQPIWPLLPLPAALLYRLWRHPAREPGRAATFALALLFFVGQRHAWHSHGPDAITIEIAHGAVERARGARLDRIFEGVDPPSIGVNLAGGVAFGYRGEVFDLLGLNDVRMGHSPGPRRGLRDHAAFDADVFWTHPPDWMLPQVEGQDFDAGCWLPRPGSFTDIVLDGLPRDAVFRSRYVPGWARNAHGERIHGFVLGRAFLRLHEQGLEVRRIRWSELDRVCERRQGSRAATAARADGTSGSGPRSQTKPR